MAAVLLLRHNYGSFPPPPLFKPRTLFNSSCDTASKTTRQKTKPCVTPADRLRADPTSPIPPGGEKQHTRNDTFSPASGPSASSASQVSNCYMTLPFRRRTSRRWRIRMPRRVLQRQPRCLFRGRRCVGEWKMRAHSPQPTTCMYVPT